MKDIKDFIKDEFVTYYDLASRSWLAYKVDAERNQVGNCGYGNSKKDAIEDCKYQATLK